MTRIATILTALLLAVGLTTIAAPSHAEETDPRDAEIAGLRWEVESLRADLRQARQDYETLYHAWYAASDDLLVQRIEAASATARAERMGEHVTVLTDRVSRLQARNDRQRATIERLRDKLDA